MPTPRSVPRPAPADLAAAGILDGQQATTHWARAEQLERHGARYTEQRVVEHGKVITAAGVSAGIDMALSLIARMHGREMALTSARNMEYVWREGADDDPFA